MDNPDNEIGNLSDEEFMAKYGDSEEIELLEEPEEKEELVDEEKLESDEDTQPESDEVVDTTTVEEEVSSDSELKEEKEITSEASISSEDQLNAIYAPFKANGTEINVKSPEEAIRLMQQGAGATKRMQDLAPKLKMIQMLENNDLLTEDAINQLIAVGSKDPAAISAFLKEADIDPFTLDTDTEYQPIDYRVNDKEFILKQTIEKLADQPKYEETLNTADSWDDKSKQIAMEDPEVLNVINGHMQSGIYDQIENVVKQEVMKGNIDSNLPFLEAYKLVGNQLQEAGSFDQSNSVNGNEQTSDEANVTSNKKGNEKLNSRRKAASSTKSIGSGSEDTADKTSSDDLFKMSDEDFMKKYADADWMNPM